jgi:hypothetical protein
MAPIYQLETTLDKAIALRNLGFDLRETNLESIPQIVESDTRDYIVITPEFSQGRYSFSVSPGRVAYGPEIEKIGGDFGRKFPNTARDSLDREFIGEINWQEAIDLNSARGESTLSLAQANIFLNLLYQGAFKNLPVYNEAGKKLDSRYLQSIFEDVVKIQSPWRAEWIDAFFEQDDTEFYILTQNKSQKQRLNGGLRENRSPGISLEAWLKNPTKQGLPRANVAEGDLYYGSPANGSVARFDVYFIRAYLYAGGSPSDRDAVLGVRAARSLAA